MKGRTLTVILTAFALAFSTAAGARAQHEGHQMPAKPVEKKATPAKKKTTTQSRARKGKTPARSSQARKAASQPTTTKDARQPTTMDHSKMDHSTMDHSKMDHSTMDHSKMDMRQPGSAEVSRMSEASRHALVLTYAQSIGTFAKTLRDKVQSTQRVDTGFALGIVDEMKRNLEAIEQQHKDHSAAMPVSTQSQMSTMMQEMQNRISALRQNLTALERDLQAEAPAISAVLQRADEIIRLSGVPPGTPHQHGPGAKPDDQRSITKLDQRDDMKEGAVVYTCTMHPEVTSNKPGKCPKCGMTLVKKKGS